MRGGVRGLALTHKNIVFSVSPVLWPLAKGKEFWPPTFGWSLFAAAFSSSHRDSAHEEELGLLLRGGGKDSGSTGPH